MVQKQAKRLHDPCRLGQKLNILATLRNEQSQDIPIGVGGSGSSLGTPRGVLEAGSMGAGGDLSSPPRTDGSTGVTTTSSRSELKAAAPGVAGR